MRVLIYDLLKWTRVTLSFTFAGASTLSPIFLTLEIVVSVVVGNMQFSGSCWIFGSLNLKQNNYNSAPYLVSTLLNWQLCTVHIMIKFHYVDYHSKFNREILTATVKQECISLECIPSAAVAASGRRCLPGGLPGGGVDPQDPEADISPPPDPEDPCEQNSWHTLVKTLAFRNYCCGR